MMTEHADARHIQLSFDLGDFDPLLERLARGESLLRVCRALRMDFRGLLRIADGDPKLAIRLEAAQERGMDLLRERREMLDEDMLETLRWAVKRRMGASGG